MNNKNVFSQNLKYQMELHGKSRQDISIALGISYFTVTSWVNGTKYPRMDKVEKLADYFGILKSELIEDKNEKISPNEPELTEGEARLIELFRKAPTDRQQLVLQMIETALRNL